MTQPQMTHGLGSCQLLQKEHLLEIQSLPDTILQLPLAARLVIFGVDQAILGSLCLLDVELVPLRE
jgi:hypothetical protein